MLMESDDFVDSDYWANNFNGKFCCLTALLNMLVANNWKACYW